MVGVIIHVIISFVIAFWLFVRCKNPIISYTVTIPITVALVIGYSMYELGYLDPFWQIAVIVLIFWSLLAVLAAHIVYKILKIIKEHKD